MIPVVINPGSGPVADATEEHAAENMRHFVTDCKVDGLRFVRVPDVDYGDGRFAFLLWKQERCHEIQMPGLPLDQVRFTGAGHQSIWDFPRLYVDGSSWVWKFAVLDAESEWTQPE
jgi:hypothetical protein